MRDDPRGVESDLRRDRARRPPRAGVVEHGRMVQTINAVTIVRLRYVLSREARTDSAAMNVWHYSASYRRVSQCTILRASITGVEYTVLYI